MDLWMWGALIIGLWIAFGVTVVVSYHFGWQSGHANGVAVGLEGRVAGDYGAEGERAIQPLAIRYTIRTGREAHSTIISGRLVFDDLTLGDWLKDGTHREIRRRLGESFPGCEIIGYAAMDRVGDEP